MPAAMDEAAPDWIENRPLAQLRVGDEVAEACRFGAQDAQAFAILAGDGEPAAEPGAAPVPTQAAAMWLAARLAGLAAARLPGPGTGLLRQELEWTALPLAGEDVHLRLRVEAIHAEAAGGPQGVLAVRAQGGDGRLLAAGRLWVRPPLEKLRRPRAHLPELQLRDPGARLRALVAQAQAALRARAGSPLPMAVVHPVDAVALGGVAEAVAAGLIAPVLVGPAATIRAAAAQAGIDLSAWPLQDAPDPEAAAAAAVALARSGRVHALMKGSLHTDALMHAVVDPQSGLRGERRISHVFLIDVVGWPRPLLLSDAAVNVLPDLAAKRDIVQNAIDLAHALGIAQPKVAILSALETVTPKIPSTLEAAALCKMAERGQIAGGILDGPLAFDNAVSLRAARTKGIASAVAGQADILVAPDLEAGNLLAKQLEYLAEAQLAGIVLGARVPVVLTSRADLPDARMASAALAVLWTLAQDAAPAAGAAPA